MVKGTMTTTHSYNSPHRYRLTLPFAIFTV